MSWSRILSGFFKKEEEVDVEAQQPLLMADDESLEEENLDDNLPENNEVVDQLTQDKADLKHIRVQLEAARLLREQVILSMRRSKTWRRIVLNASLVGSFGGGLCLIGAGAAGIIKGYFYQPAVAKLNYLMHSAAGQEMQTLINQFFHANIDFACQFIYKKNDTQLNPNQVFPYFLHFNSATHYYMPACNSTFAWQPNQGVNCSLAGLDYMAGLQHQICSLDSAIGYSHLNNNVTLYWLMYSSTGVVFNLFGACAILGSVILAPMMLDSYRRYFDNLMEATQLDVKGEELELLEQLDEESGFNQLLSGIYHVEPEQAQGEGQEKSYKLMLVPLITDLERYEAELKVQEERLAPLVQYKPERQAFLTWLNDSRRDVRGAMVHPRGPDSIVAMIFKYAGWLHPETKEYDKRIQFVAREEKAKQKSYRLC